MAAATLLIVAGGWVLMQTLVGDLPRRIVSWRLSISEADAQLPGSGSRPRDPGDGETDGRTTEW